MVRKRNLPDTGSEQPNHELMASRDGKPRFSGAVWAATGWMLLVTLAALLANLLPLPDPLLIDASAIAQGPGQNHVMGADELGRDILSRIVFGARTSLLIGIGVVAIAGPIGGILGIAAGYARGKVDSLVMGVMDALLSFPALVLALAMTAFLGASVRNLIIAISVLAVPSFARVSRSRALALATREFVLAAKGIGAPEWRILAREILPNVIPTVTTYALLVIAIAIIVEGSLSFLGLGVPPPTPTWGGMVNAGKGHLDNAPHIALIPSGALLLTVLSLNVLGERLRNRWLA